ncbi:hypothetical protein [Glycomyces tarimensis]
MHPGEGVHHHAEPTRADEAERAMTYPPPPGGYDPQQYHVSSQPPQQPSDPYAQGYNAPPPPNYGPGPGQYQQPPNMTPPIGVQPGYPPGAPSPLPPQVPPPQQGGNLGIILGVIVGLVVLLGVAAILIVPGMLEDDGPTTAGEETTSDAEERSSEDEATAEEEESPAAEEESGSGDFGDWGTAISSDDFEENSPEGAAIRWEIAVDDGDLESLAALMCSSPSEGLQREYDYEAEYGQAWNYDFIIWAIAKEPANGQVELWAGWTWDDTAPASQEDLDSGGGNYYTAVEEDGTWKICDIAY